jgi:hypothetical protein
MSKPQHGNKVGRNDPCPCGSGKKFKKCHGASMPQIPMKTQLPDPEALRKELARIQALHKQRQQQQGFGKSIVTTVFEGYRIVAVGGKVFHSRSWKTFHDFLFDYIKMLLGSDWGNAELKKPREERHPILNWYHDATIPVGGRGGSPPTG